MRRGICIGLGAAVSLVCASSAQGAFHLMKVSEVSAGSGADASFIELQMIAGGQNQVANHTITVRGSNGSIVGTFTLPSNVDQGVNQHTILVADTNGPAGADFTWPEIDLGQEITAGAVCFDDGDPPDCIAWGLGFSGSAALPDSSTAFPGDLPIGNSLTRVITRGCNTLLDPADDRNLGADYVITTASPRPNSTTPTENGCPSTQILAKPAAETADRTPRFTFSGGDRYSCKLDREPYEECGTPFKPGRLELGKHKLRVRATENDGSIDRTPAKYTWKIIPR